MRAIATVLALLGILAGVGVVVSADAPSPDLAERQRAKAPGAKAPVVIAPASAVEATARKVPTSAAMSDAWAYARARDGVVSLAVVDTDGRLRGRLEHRLYAAASTVKAVLLAAELRRLKHERAPLDPATRALLEPMITASDNGAADAIYGRVGDAGVFAAADRAGMTGLTLAGHWGNAQVTAADLARFFGDLDRQFPRESREYAKGLLGSVIETQAWGVPVAAGEGWAVRFKGGWLPDHALVHQAAELHERDGGRRLAIAVLTDDQPSHAYGVETVQGVAERLLGVSASGGP